MANVLIIANTRDLPLEIIINIRKWRGSAVQGLEVVCYMESSNNLFGSDIRWIAMLDDVAALNVDISAPTPTRSPEVCCRRLVAGTCWVTWPVESDCEETRAWNDAALTQPTVDCSVSLTLFDTSHISIYTRTSRDSQSYLVNQFK